MKTLLFKKIFRVLYKCIVANFIVFGTIFGKKIDVKDKQADKRIESKK